MTECNKGLTVKERSNQGLTGGISHLIYVTARTCEVGKGMIKRDDRQPPKDIQDGSQEYFPLSMSNNMAPLIFSEWPAEKAIETTNTQFLEHSARSYFDHLTWAGYQDVSCTFVLCTQDQIIKSEMQSAVIDILRKHAPHVQVVEFESGHCPMVTRLEPLVKALAEILGKL